MELHVKNLKKSIEDFTRPGYKFNSRVSDRDAICMIVREDIFVMLLVGEFLKTFTIIQSSS